MIAALRARDEAAFATLIDRNHAQMVRIARSIVGEAHAEEVAQETWVAVITGIDRFEGRSSLRTWILRILVNRARTRRDRERRSVPFSSLVAAEAAGDEPAVDPDRFLGPDHARWPGHWAAAPTAWAGGEERLLARETRDVVAAAIAALAPGQRAVISLRDVEGWSAQEVCNALDITETNQRVLLHRARSRVRAALELHLGET